MIRWNSELTHRLHLHVLNNVQGYLGEKGLTKVNKQTATSLNDGLLTKVPRQTSTIDNKTNLSNFISSNFLCHNWIQHGNYFQMSTNKPCSVVLEISSVVLRTFCNNFRNSHFYQHITIQYEKYIQMSMTKPSICLLERNISTSMFNAMLSSADSKNYDAWF